MTVRKVGVLDMRYIVIGFFLSIFSVVCSGEVFVNEKKDMNVLYASLTLPLKDQERADLQRLLDAGINTLMVHGFGASEVQQRLDAFKADPLLTKFRYILYVGGTLGDAWAYYEPDVCKPGAEYIPEWVKPNLQEIAKMALINKDKVAGYYLFDEPGLGLRSRGDRAGKPGICKRYQELARDYIRSFDPDSKSRPVINANNLGELSDSDIDYSMSPAAQDVMMIVQYYLDRNALTQQHQKWKSHGLSSVPFIYIYPAFGVTTCADPALVSAQQTLNSVVASVYGDAAPAIRGSSYFAYWPGNKPDFAYGMDNCAGAFNSSLSHVASLPDVAITKIVPSNAVVSTGGPVTFDVTIKNVGQTAVASQWIGVVALVDENTNCGPAGCMWGGVISSLAPGEEKVIPVNKNGSWTATKGVHNISVFVDDQLRIQERRKDNNLSTIQLSVFDAPTMTLTVTPTVIKPGEIVVRRWSSQNTTACQSKTGTPLEVSGEWPTLPVYSSNVYEITCMGPGGTVKKSIAVTVVP